MTPEEEFDMLSKRLALNHAKLKSLLKGKPKKDGSGKGTRKNKGRGGCTKQKKTGKGK